MTQTNEHVRKNREHWEREADEYQDRNRAQLNRWTGSAGGFDAREDEIHALGDVEGVRAWSSAAVPASSGSRSRCAARR